MARWSLGTEIMAPRPPSKRRSGEQRLRIIRKAAELFRERGYHGVTVDDIAKAVGVSKLGVYYYLDSKEEILYEIHRMAHNAVLSAWRDAVDSEGSPGERLQRALRAYVEIICSEMSFTTSLLLHLYDLPSPQRRGIVKMRDEVERHARDLIQGGVESGEFHPCDPALMTFAIFGAINFMPYWYSPKGRLSKDQIVDAFVDYLMRGLLTEPAADEGRLVASLEATPSTRE